MKELVHSLQKEGVLKTQLIIEAFLKNDRQDFVAEGLAGEAYWDVPLPIGSGQTISQPYTVAFMLELLDLKPGQKVLDVGFGSGWTTALLATIVGGQGAVYGLEILPELFELGKANLSKQNFKNIKLRKAKDWEGWPEAAPFDRILVSAAAGRVPEKFKAQLVKNGKMVIPVGREFTQSIKLVERVNETKFKEKDFSGFAFVPLVKK